MYPHFQQTHFEEETKVDLIREFHFLVQMHFREKHAAADYADLLYKSPKNLSNAFKKWEKLLPYKLSNELHWKHAVCFDIPIDLLAKSAMN